MKKDMSYLHSRKQAQQKITMLTCYDYPTALLEEKAGIDVIFVGDSVGTNVLGYASETEVTMEDMVHHLKAVRRGVTDAYLLADLPYRSYDTPELALQNARLLLAHGADGVKLEGGAEQEEVVRTLAQHGIEVCGHIGFTPQTLGSKGKVQGKSFEQAKGIVQSALALEDAGLTMIVLELITEQISKILTERLRIPTIGIGAGRFCDGQVLVVNDILGISPFNRKITRRYQNFHDLALQAISQYKSEVEQQLFPNEANAFALQAEELAELESWATNVLH